MDFGILASKTVLLFLSLIFWLAGAALAYISSYVIISYKNFSSFTVDKYAIIPVAIILAVAIVMFIVGIIGCCATLRESNIGLGIFLLIILLIFAAEVTALVFGVIYERRISGELDKSMNDVFEKYDGKNSETKAVDYLQSEMECCGVLNYTDWSTRPWFTSHNSVPKSCCKANTTCSGQLNHPEVLNTNGCKVKLEKLLQDVLSTGLLVILGFAIIKLLGILSICVIACRSSRNEYEPLYA
ncbi:tetraspanin 36 [Tachysurus ichikawai]